MKTRIEIKEQARALIRTNQIWKAIGLPNLILSLIVFVTILLMPKHYHLPVYIFAFIAAFYELAAQIYLYKVVKNEIEVSEGFSNQVKDILNCLTKENIYTFLVSNALIFCWALIPFAGAFIALVKSYSYSLSIFYSNDYKTNSPMQNITKSRIGMNGNKMALFIQHLSFFGWEILSFFTMGILSVWLQPYILASEVIFMDNITKEEK